MSDAAVAGVRRRGSIAPLATKRTAVGHDLAAEVLQGADAYAALLPEWERLMRLHPGAALFQTPALLAAWARHFACARSGASTATVVLRHEGRAVLIWPLVIERRGLVRVAAGAGAPIGQYDEILLDPHVDGKAALSAALRALNTILRPDLVLLERVRADSMLRAALLDEAPFCSGEAAPYADLSNGMAAVLAGQKPRVARQQRKRLKRFTPSVGGAVALARDAAEAEAWLVEALALKRDWLRSTGRMSRAFVKAETANCLAELARSLSDAEASPRMVVAKLSLDGRTAAIEAGFAHRGAYHLYLGAFAPEFGKLGPGNVLTQHVLQWCVENGIKRYDMLAPRSRHKSEWQTNEVEVVDFALPSTRLGRIYAQAVLKWMAPALRDGFYALPAGLRSAIAGITLRM